MNHPETYPIINGNMDTQKCSSEIEEIKITGYTIEQKLKKLNPNKSPGPDGMHPKLLLETSSKITNALYEIYNTSLQE